MGKDCMTKWSMDLSNELSKMMEITKFYDEIPERRLVPGQLYYLFQDPAVVFGQIDSNLDIGKASLLIMPNPLMFIKRDAVTNNSKFLNGKNEVQFHNFAFKVMLAEDYL